jgi:cytochrome c oxidase cbb3-type subunit 3
MARHFPRLLAAVVSLCIGNPIPILEAQAQPPSPAVTIEGQEIFASSCAACHGLDGRGGERAPNIASSPKVQRLPAAEIFRIVQDGVPGTGMPAFRSLGTSGVKAVVSYLRTLQGRSQTAALPGDPRRGKSVFFGNTGCSRCHMANGEGGFIASDLSHYARTRSLDEMREAITNPVKNLGPRERMVIAITREGPKYVGVPRNEDNFSLQLQTLDGAFHFFMKADLEHLEYQSQSLMPSDYGSTLSRRDLDDVISYLVSIAKTSKAEPASRNEE